MTTMTKAESMTMTDELVKQTYTQKPQLLAVQVTQELADTRYDDPHFVRRMMRRLQRRSAGK